MNSLNKVFLIGHLGKDPEVRYTPQGNATVNFSLATTEKWTDKGGQKQEKTDWHNVVAWNKTAEICGQYLRKGSPVHIEGKITNRSWEDRDGTKKYKTEIVAQNINFLEQNHGQNQGYAPRQQYDQRPAQEQPYPQPQENFGVPQPPLDVNENGEPLPF